MGVISGGEVQAIDNLRKAMEESSLSIKRLNVWLVWLTLGIALMTGVQVLVALKVISR